MKTAQTNSKTPRSAGPHEILAAIRHISQQTNLLAPNAGIEGSYLRLDQPAAELKKMAAD